MGGFPFLRFLRLTSSNAYGLKKKWGVHNNWNLYSNMPAVKKSVTCVLTPWGVVFSGEVKGPVLYQFSHLYFSSQTLLVTSQGGWFLELLDFAHTLWKVQQGPEVKVGLYSFHWQDWCTYHCYKTLAKREFWLIRDLWEAKWHSCSYKSKHMGFADPHYPTCMCWMNDWMNAS